MDSDRAGYDDRVEEPELATQLMTALSRVPRVGIRRCWPHTFRDFPAMHKAVIDSIDADPSLLPASLRIESIRVRADGGGLRQLDAADDRDRTVAQRDYIARVIARALCESVEVHALPECLPIHLANATQAWQQESIDYLLLVPLVNCGHINDARIGDFQLRRLSYFERELLRELPQNGFIPPISVLARPMAISKSESAVPWPAVQRIARDAERVIAAMRLAQPGGFGAQFLFGCPVEEHWQTGPWPSLVYTMAEGSPRAHHDGMRLFEPEHTDRAAELLSQWAAIQQVDLAVRRWSSAMGRERTEDALVDSIIALESLFGVQRLSYVTNLRATAFLAPMMKPEATLATLEKVTKLRNRVVHGGESIETEQDRKAIEKVLQITHAALLAMIERLVAGENYKDVRNAILNNVVKTLR